jgi:general secretion pathway protein H
MGGVEPLPLRQGGFTLLEIMVVLMIIGVILSMGTLSIDLGGGEEKLRVEAQRLRALLELASEEAEISFREVGVAFEEQAYSFHYYQDASGESPAVWLPMDGNSTFRVRHLPAGFRIGILLEGEPVALGDPVQEEDNPTQGVLPQLLLLSSGEATPFVVTLSGPDGQGFEIQGDELAHMMLRSLDGVSRR